MPGIIILKTGGGGGMDTITRITGYVKILLLFRESMRLWDFPGDLTQSMNKDHIIVLWEDICLTLPAKFLVLVLEVVMNSRLLCIKSIIKEPNIDSKGRRQVLK